MGSKLLVGEEGKIFNPARRAGIQNVDNPLMPDLWLRMHDDRLLLPEEIDHLDQLPPVFTVAAISVSSVEKRTLGMFASATADMTSWVNS